MCADSDGAVAVASGNYGGGPWVWLGGNDCQASAEAIAGTGFNDDNGAFAAAGAQACMPPVPSILFYTTHARITAS